MKAFIHLPHAPRSSVHVGKVFIRSAEHGKHLWKNRIFDLSDEKQRAEFNSLCTTLCVRDTIYGQTPVPFILPPEPPAQDAPPPALPVAAIPEPAPEPVPAVHEDRPAAAPATKHARKKTRT